MDGAGVSALHELVRNAREHNKDRARHPTGSRARGDQSDLRKSAIAAAELVRNTHQTRRIDLTLHPCAAELADLIHPETAIVLSALPHSRMGGRLIVATARPDLHREIARAFPGEQVLLALTTPDQIGTAIGTLYGDQLARRAETRVPLSDSARSWTGHQLSLRLAAPLLCLAALFLVLPQQTLLGLYALAGLVFLANMGLKLAATASALKVPNGVPDPVATPLYREPVITLLVPLYKEKNVARHILARIGKLDYPREKLDVIFVLEADDQTTTRALQSCTLPGWARAITVPPGNPQTKPRALNYALPFARGTILGIYDAEDAPERDQLRRVAARFAASAPNVACLQGQLDYYNATHNWISRCFTMEYATWFRLMLPGVARMGLVVPLGGTTLFIKRDALLRVGAWDAHNVTEDAELGIRLHRHGYRTELLQTTTFEEANSALWPWVRQRTRWLKGYAITWATLMRDPRGLWRDLGAWRFFGMQVQIAGTVLGFVAAPLLWSLAFIPLGQPHPIEPYLTGPVKGAMIATFACSAFLTLAISWRACAAPHLRRHRVWLPILLIYFPLATIAALWAVLELAIKPFYWAKTEHGAFGGADAMDQSPASSKSAASALSRTSNATLR